MGLPHVVPDDGVGEQLLGQVEVAFVPDDRSDIDIDTAVKDITSAVFGIAFQWVAVPQAHDLDDELNSVRCRIIRQYGPPSAR
jgi:hypothetical protein